MKRLRKDRADISHLDSAKRFSNLGVDVFLGEAKFLDRHTIEVADAKLKFKKAVVATGARAYVPDIEGLEDSGFHTNESIFSLEELPSSLAIIGAGPIGCEMAQAFSRLGSRVILFSDKARILPKDDIDASNILTEKFTTEGIRIELNTKIVQVSSIGDTKILTLKTETSQKEIETQALLVAAGRAPNVEGLNLESAGIQYSSRHGIKVNEFLQTTAPNIYSAGDVCMNYQFTHAADFAARTVIQNALFAPFGFGKKSIKSLLIPWCTYCEPEIAHVGISESQAKERNIEIETYLQKFNEVDRSILEGHKEGFVKIHCKAGSDTILGATIVHPNAGDLISEITLSIQCKIGLSRIASVIHPYPTNADAVRKLGDIYNKKRLSPFIKKILSTWLSITK